MVLCACVVAPSLPAPKQPPSLAPVAAPQALAAAPAQCNEPAKARPWTCRVEPAPVLPAAPDDGVCVAVPAAVRQRLQARMRRLYEPTADEATLAITFECDPLGRPVELIYETGSGHGQDLTLVRLRQQGRRYAALRITWPGGHDGSDEEFVVERGSIARPAIDHRIADLRGLTLAWLEERLPDDSESDSSYWSSNDWHGLLRITDESGRAIERSFTGYESSAWQFDSIPLTEVATRLDPLLERIPWRPAAVDSDVLSFFSDRFLAAGPERAEWWVKERLVLLAAHVGTTALIGQLIALAQTHGSDASVERTRAYAVAALAAITGFDARQTADGSPVETDDAAAVYAEACM